MPAYFRFVTLVAYHAFLSLGVDATILEVGVGGLHDSTNIVPKPVVTGVTALGLDHTAVLGNTIKEIAYQKGGIYKVPSVHFVTRVRVPMRLPPQEGVPALTVNQPEEGYEMLRQQAQDRKVSTGPTTTCPAVHKDQARRPSSSSCHLPQAYPTLSSVRLPPRIWNPKPNTPHQASRASTSTRTRASLCTSRSTSSMRRRGGR